MIGTADIIRGMRDSLSAEGVYPPEWEAANEWLSRNDENPINYSFDFGGMGGRYAISVGDEFIGHFYYGGDRQSKLDEFFERIGAVEIKTPPPLHNGDGAN